jgi:D-alanyl-D-alanine dipeptidase
MEHTNLVYIDEYGLLGSNFYWHKYATHGLTKEDILDAGVTSDRVQVHKDIVNALVDADKEIQEQKGWRLYVKEGYRSRGLYEIVYKRRTEKYGKEVTDSLLNMKDMPHAEGKSVDIAVWDPNNDKEVYLRRAEDGTLALFINFYKDKDDAESKRYQGLQDYLANLMVKHGFRIGTKREYFHFDYRPETPPNYESTGI